MKIQAILLPLTGKNVVITFSELGFSEGKIEAEENTYTFAYANDGSLAITYPDGYIYTQMEINGGIASTGDYDSDAMKKKGYIDGMSLARAISSAADGQRTQRQEGSAFNYVAVASCRRGVDDHHAKSCMVDIKGLVV